MNTESLLTLLGLLAALYSILPTEQKLDLRLRLRLLDWSLAVSSLVIVHYIAFVDAPRLGPWLWGLTDESGSYLVLVCAAVTIAARAHHATLDVKRLHIFRQLLDKLTATEVRPEAFYLLERHLPALMRIERELARASDRSRSSAVQYNLVRAIARQVLTTPHVVSETALRRPALAIQLLEFQGPDEWEYQELLIQALLSEHHSPLYYEIAHNQNLKNGHRYRIEDDHAYIQKFAGDPIYSDRRNVSQDFGEYCRWELSRLRHDPDGYRYNQPLGDYDKKGKWQCPLFIPIRLIDILVLEALHRGVTSHVWLAYYEILARPIVSAIEPTPDADLSSEWPTPYHYLLTAMIAAMRSWLIDASAMPRDQRNTVVGSMDMQYDPLSIAKSACIAVGHMAMNMIGAGSLRDSYKRRIVDLIVDTSLDLARSARPELGSMLLSSLVEGGGLASGGHGAAHRAELRQVMAGIDPHLLAEVTSDAHLGTLMAPLMEA
jgi:hypothetical protein